MIHGGTSVVASRGVASEANFQINASPQAFRILSSGLYSDKITAVLREIACNAVDAHVAAGKPDLPIEVKLPTKLDPSFYVKDWGTGLTDEQVKGLYTTYFLSDKDAANDLIGGLGLGSKSPFSYTDSFMVTVAKDGVKRFYTAHIGEDGSPVITALGDPMEAEEDWQNGVMVSFPVAPKDIPEFHSKAQLCFRWFRIKPRTIGSGNPEEPKYGLRGSNYRLGPPEDISTALVLMGNIPYPLNLERLGTKDPVISALVRAHVLLEMPIGSVMPTASREELEYDSRTRENLLEALLGVGKEIAEQIVQIAQENGKTEWERMVALNRYARELPSAIRAEIGRFFLLTDLSTEEREKLCRLFAKGGAVLPPTIGRRHLFSKSGKKSTLRVHMYWQADPHKQQVSRREVNDGRIAQGSSMEHAVAPYLHDVKIVIGDAPHAHERVREFVRDAGKYFTRILITGVNKETLTNAEAYAKEISDALGGVPVIRAAELQVPEILRLKKAKAKAKGVKVSPDKLHAKELVKYWEASKGYSVESATQIKLSEIPESGRYYLIEDRRRHPFEALGRLRFGFREMDRFMNAYQKLLQAGIPLATIGGVVIGTAAKIRALGLKEAGWGELFTTVLDSFRSESVLEVLKAQTSKMPVLGEHYRWGRSDDCLLTMLAKEAAKDTTAWKVFEPVVKQNEPLRRLLRELLSAATPKNPRGEMRRKLDKMRECWRVLAEPLEALELLEDYDLRSVLEEVYPLSAYIDTELLRRDAERWPEKAANALKGALHQQTELAKSPQRRSVPDASELQMPLAFSR